MPNHRRSPILRAAGAISLCGCVLCGCATQGLSFGRTAKTVQTHPDPSEVRAVAHEEAETAEEGVVREDAGGVVEAEYQRSSEGDGPFRDSRPIDSRTTDRTSDDRTIYDSEVRPVSRTDDGPPEETARRLDSATLRLIDSELADATPEERAEFYETIRDVDPQLVPHMLRLRRTMAERAKLRAEEATEQAVREAERRGRSVERVTAEQPGDEPRTADASMDIRPRTATAATPSARDTARGSGDRVQQAGVTHDVRGDGKFPDEDPLFGQRRAPADVASAETNATWPPNDVMATDDRSTRALSREPVSADTPADGGWPPARPPRGSVEASMVSATRSLASRSRDEWPGGFGSDRPEPEVRKTVVEATRREGLPLTDADGRYTLANDYDEQLHRLIDLMEQDLSKRAEPATDADHEEMARLHVFLRMLYLMDGQQARTMQAIPHLSEPHQEFWTQLFWGLSNYFDSQNIPEAGHRATEAVMQLRAAAERLQPEARLLLRNATFCHRINSFGTYDRFDRDEFAPGQAVLVYLEVRNFQSELQDTGEYSTRLRTTVEIHRAGRGPQAGLIETTDFPTTEDTCRSLRQDYFNSYRIDLPETLTAGPHVLKLIVEDELSHRVATSSLSFTVR